MALLKLAPKIDPAYRRFMDHRVRHTPDALELFSQNAHFLFVYDGMMSKHLDFPKIVKHGPTLFPGYTDYPTVFTMSGFTMFYDCPSGSVVPLFSEEDGFFPRAKIKGQLHLVSPKLIHSLDIDRQNGVQFKRRKVKLLLPYRGKMSSSPGECRKKDPETGDWERHPLPGALRGWRHKETPERMYILKDVWMYVGRKTYWDPRLDGGYTTLQCPIHFPNVEKNWLPRYYEYTRTFEEAQRPNR